MPDKRHAASTFIGAGWLHMREQAICEVAYHLVGWHTLGPDGKTANEIYLCGVLRRLDGGELTELVGRDDLTLHLSEAALWWRCTIVAADGWATMRDGSPSRDRGDP
jgi:hypothetical protein